MVIIYEKIPKGDTYELIEYKVHLPLFAVQSLLETGMSVKAVNTSTGEEIQITLDRVAGFKAG